MINDIKTISVVITSCNRFDLLDKTLESFFKFNTYPLNQIIIIEDSSKDLKIKMLIEKYRQHNITLIVNNDRIGQMSSINKAYSHVNSDYIFHCEDDWEFFEYGFIEKSLNILLLNKKILSVWLRDISEYNNIKFSEEVFVCEGCNYKLVYDEILSFNPSLKRCKDTKLITDFTKFKQTIEKGISNFYLQKKFVSAILLQPHVKHLGYHRRVLNADTKVRKQLIYNMDNLFKKIKVFFYKKLQLGHYKRRY